jgi:hypothetical protein
MFTDERGILLEILDPYAEVPRQVRDPFPSWQLLGTSLPRLIECPLIQEDSHGSR